MNVKSVEKQEKSTVELVIEIGKEEFEALSRRSTRSSAARSACPVSARARPPGRSSSMYGSGVFYEDAINDLYPEPMPRRLSRRSWMPWRGPRWRIVDVGKEGLTFKAWSPSPRGEAGRVQGPDC